MSRSDLVLPISEYSHHELIKFWAESLDSKGMPAALAARVHTARLPEGKRCRRHDPPNIERDTVLMLGTVEPRKQQVKVLEALNKLARENPKIAKLRIVVIGSLHPESSDAFHKAISENQNAFYHDYSKDGFIEECYSRALFTVFASNDEGFGLPIAESVSRGVPCLCAEFGSMAEVAEGGGCLTIDVNDSASLHDGLHRMATDSVLLDRLREEAKSRPLRQWSDYASDVVRMMIEASRRDDLPPLASSTLAPVDAMLKLTIGGRRAALLRMQHIAKGGWGAAIGKLGELRASGGVIAVDAAGWCEASDTLSQGARAALYRADAVVFSNDAERDSFVQQSVADGFEGLLPVRMRTESDAAIRNEWLFRALSEAARRRNKVRQWADDERQLAALSRQWVGSLEEFPVILNIVISTYNRSAFVCENVRWLRKHLGRFNGRVRLTVIDNASTDDSWRALQEFAASPNIELHRNPSNTGMLGNLRVCSMVQGGRHVWIVGDDDFILPDAIDDILKVLEKEPGICEVRDAAVQHDNMFTAVYPIVWRADIVAACFNYPFTGVPFIDLGECVPTTKILLESYSHAPCYWRAKVGIVANAHNSWSRHRPRWHGYLMPLVFELAKEAGVDSATLYHWAQTHRTLFGDAIEIAQEKEFPVHLNEYTDLEPAYRVFRERLALPTGIHRWSDPLAQAAQ